MRIRFFDDTSEKTTNQNVPHSLTSQASNADVQRAEDTLGTFLLPNVSLTFSDYVMGTGT